MIIQHLIEDRHKRSLKEFTQFAITYLEQNPLTDEVVQLAENITELEKDSIIAPENIYKLPGGYEYNFSGFFGHVIGVGRIGIRELHKRGV